MKGQIKFFLVLFFSISLIILKAQGVQFDRDFAPTDQWIKPQEKPYRDGVCLNGNWQFLPVTDASILSEQQLLHPQLPQHPEWAGTPLKIPSPWNVNSFTDGRGGDFITYPSYPRSWDSVRAGWMKRNFSINRSWKGKRIVLHFEAVAGYTQVFVNGKKAGENFDLFLPFEIDITDLVKGDRENELLVWVADAQLFNQPGKYGNRIHVAGSFWGQHAIGIWQDVYLVALPPVNVQNIFIKPFPDRGELEIEATLHNETGKAKLVNISGSIMPWINKTDSTILEAPEVKWELGKRVLSIPVKMIKLQAQSSQKINFTVNVSGKLKLWTAGSPNLYGLVLQVKDNQVLDKKYERFGWRQFSIVKDKFYLNGKPLVLKGDSWHFMGIPQMTRRYAWSWFTMLKKAHGNAVRLHAQPYPKFYLDMADEMGVFVLDETGIWASDGGPKADAEQYWVNCEGHLRRLILRDRNHPSVFGWSVCNENLPVVMNVQRAPETVIKRQVEEINKWVGIVREMDPSRVWISGDGETNLPTSLPVIIGHYGFENEMRTWSSQGKVWGIGEQGMAYSGTPRQVARFNGNRAYESQQGRMEGLAKEAIQLLNLQKKYQASYSSIFNLVWYGLKPIALGMKDTSRAPVLSDGIFFKPFVQGKAGVQPERLGPYVTTLNPGYDKQKPLFETWPLYDAVTHSFADTAELQVSMEYRQQKTLPLPTDLSNQVILLSNDMDSVIAKILNDLNIGYNKTSNYGKNSLLIIDGKFPPMNAEAIEIEKTILKKGGRVLVWGVDPSSSQVINKYLPYSIELTLRKASSFLVRNNDQLINGLNNSDFYFSEMSRTMPMQYGLQGELVRRGNILLEACNTEWKTWNYQPETIKTAAVLRSEREKKPAGTALVEIPVENGSLFVFSLEPAIIAGSSVALLRRIFLNLGIAAEKSNTKNIAAISSTGVVDHALVLGSFNGGNKTIAEMSRLNFLEGTTKETYFPGGQVQNRFWETVTANEGVFDLNHAIQSGPTENAFAYLSFWVYSPRSLSNLLLEPDMPRLDLFIGADDGFQLFLNQQLIKESLKEGGLKKREQIIKGLPLEKGWNHFLVKVLQKGGDWKLSMEFDSDKKDFLQELKSQSAPPL